MPSLTSSTVLSPSDIVDYLPISRVMELLTEDYELDDDEDPPSVDTIDSNDRALMLVRWAWYSMKMACKRGDIYGERELVDLANDEVRGQPLRELIASLFWNKLIGRRRYVEGEPQGKDEYKKEADATLQLLREGERIFDLEDVTKTDSSGTSIGTYINELGDATKLSVGTYGKSVGRRPDDRFWACTTDRGGEDPREFPPGSAGCGCR